jgi:uncharacterized protein YbjT (DUF2867 family)
MIDLIITGATGMVGEGVLRECLQHPGVRKILAISRRLCGISHPKLSEIIHKDFLDITSLENLLKGYNACFFCLGVSSVGMKKEEYFKVTYTLTMNFAGTLARLNPDMIFCYISGAGTDSTGKGKLSWARVKGKTENDLIKLPFKKVYNFRPGFLFPSEEQKNIHGYYAFFKILYPFFRTVMPKFVSTLNELGIAMINAVIKGYEKQVIEVPDILKLGSE